MDADCIKLTSYFGERHRIDGTSTGNALLDLHHRHNASDDGSGARTVPIPAGRRRPRTCGTPPTSWR